MPIDLVTPSQPPGSKDLNSSSSPEYVLNLQDKLHETHAKARECQKSATFRQQKYYNNRLKANSFECGTLVYYHYPVKKCAKEKYRQWRGPYAVVKKFSDCVYKIQQSPRATPLIVNHDRLKLAHPRDSVDTSWVFKLPQPEPKEVPSEVAENELANGNGKSNMPDTSDHTRSRPKRPTRRPNRLGDWHYECLNGLLFELLDE